MRDNPLKRYKVMLEDHHAGTVTRKEFALEDVLKIMNGVPGTTGTGYIYKEVNYSGKEPVEVCTIPAGATVKTVAIKDLSASPVPTPEGEEYEGPNLALKVGTTSIGTTEKGVFNKGDATSSESEKDQPLTLEADDDDANGTALVVVTYEQFNELEPPAPAA